MSKFSNAIYTLYNNPFVLTPLLVAYFQNLKPQPRNVMFAYLAFPLVLHKDSQTFLCSANTRSNLYTFKSKKSTLFGLQERIANYKNMTNLCLQHAINNGYLTLNSDLSITFNSEYKNQVVSLDSAFKAAKNCHKIIKDRELVSVFQLLGVHKL